MYLIFSRFVYTGHRCPSSKCSNQLWLSQNGWDVSSSYWSLWEIWSSWDCNQFDNVWGPLCSASHRARTWHRDQTYSKSKEFKLLSFFFLSFLFLSFCLIKWFVWVVLEGHIYMFCNKRYLCNCTFNQRSSSSNNNNNKTTANDKCPVFRYSHYVAHKAPL